MWNMLTGYCNGSGIKMVSRAKRELEGYLSKIDC
jgi:hypothetical protein